MTGAKPGSAVQDYSILTPTLILVADIKQKNVVVKIEKRKIEDPMLGGQGPVDHLVGSLFFEAEAKEVLFSSDKSWHPNQTVKFTYEVVTDLLNYPAGTKLRSDREAEFKRELEYWPSKGGFIFRLIQTPGDSFKLYAFSPLDQLNAVKAFVSGLQKRK